MRDGATLFSRFAICGNENKGGSLDVVVADALDILQRYRVARRIFCIAKLAMISFQMTCAADGATHLYK